MVRKKRAVCLVAFLLVAAAVACSSSEDTGGGGPTSTGQGTVGPSGGHVATSDGVLTVTVPAGAVRGDTQITISEITSPAPGAIGKTFEIGPSGTQFSVPVTLAFKYTAIDLAGGDPSSLEVATIANGAWVALASQTVDPGAQIATGQTTHLSPYGVHAKAKSDGNDAGAASDASTSDDGSTHDSGTTTGAQDSGTDASLCTRVAQQVGSCANHPLQICSGGKVFTNCVDVQPMGYVAYCCPQGG